MNERGAISTEFSRALARLRTGVAEDPEKSDLVYDGVIQRFEFCFELAWKLLKSLLHHQGIESPSPRSCIKEAHRAGILPDGDAWIGMLEARNRTSHIYDQEDARAVYKQIKSAYVALLISLEERAMRILSE
jgi:nucleotidyltransferase substrate binding protein (TIGR01987 family)